MAKSLSYCDVTDKGIVAWYQASRIPGAEAEPSAKEVDDAVQRELAAACATLDITPAQLDVVTFAEQWTEEQGGFIPQLFRWTGDADKHNWRARIGLGRPRPASPARLRPGGLSLFVA